MEDLLHLCLTMCILDLLLKAQSEKAQHILEKLYFYFCSNPDKLPKDFLYSSSEDTLERRVCDYNRYD